MTPRDCYCLYPPAVWNELWLTFREFPCRRVNRARLLSCLQDCADTEEKTERNDPFAPNERELVEARIARFLPYRMRKFPLIRHTINTEVYSVRLPFCRILVNTACTASDITSHASHAYSSWHIYVLSWDGVAVDHPRCIAFKRPTNFKSIVVYVLPPRRTTAGEEEQDDFQDWRDRITVNTPALRDTSSSKWRNIASRNEGLFFCATP